MPLVCYGDDQSHARYVRDKNAIAEVDGNAPDRLTL